MKKLVLHVVPQILASVDKTIEGEGNTLYVSLGGKYHMTIFVERQKGVIFTSRDYSDSIKSTFLYTIW